MQSIITKYLEGRATEQEQKQLLVWLRKKENRAEFHSFRLKWKKDLDAVSFPGNGEESWNNIQEQLLQKSYGRWQQSRKIQQVFRIAAIFFFIVSLAGAIWFFADRPAPAQIHYSSVIAENGQISKVELPDGSQVWLNSGSEIKYNNQFAAANRELELKGEAYIHAAKNPEIPMVVKSGEINVKVLGTRFNVSAYPKSGFVDVVLEEGSVELFSPESEDFQLRLTPGERAQYDRQERKLAVSNVNISKFTAWKEGMMNIYDQSLAEVTQRLETRYNQEFVVDKSAADYHFTFTIKNEPLDEIIRLMEKIAPVKAVQNDTIITFKLDEQRAKIAGG